MIHLFGIRHHGPGSARSLIRALEALAPDAILIEAPADAEGILRWAAETGMEPPVAMLIFNIKELQQAAFFPFAGFSPEWQAILYGLKNSVPVRCMDLPMSQVFALSARTSQLTLEMEESELEDGEQTSLLSDPFGYVAQLGGYTDTERWWEVVVEQHHADERLFPAVQELMTELRIAQKRPEDRETLLREAWMRQTIRTAEKEGFKKIAVVCGAWHTPALAQIPNIKTSADAALLKGLKKVKTAATWIPWSFDRLASTNGYSAGIEAPAWYELLSRTGGEEAVTIWMSRAARLLRGLDLAASAANVIEAVRMAQTLAVLRRMALPGIAELREAAVSVLCGGEEKPLELIDRELVIGDVLGSVPDNLPVPPLKADFEAEVKSCRLEKKTTTWILDLDLREVAHLRKSKLLHRLLLLELPWGKLLEANTRRQGSFHENWELKWLPDFEIRLLEAVIWGNTVEEAAGRKARQTARESSDIAALTHLLGTALKADLPEVIPVLVQKIETISARAVDAFALADTVLPLTEALRYGSARHLPVEALTHLLGGIVPRVCLGLPGACLHLDEEHASGVLRRMQAVNRAMGILQNDEFQELWLRALKEVTAGQETSPLLGGFAARLLFDKQVHSEMETALQFQFRLSARQTVREAAYWLDGFLQGSALLLLHQPALWALIDNWVADLEEDRFTEVLPLMRRTFSRFEGPEREQMLARAGRKMDMEHLAGARKEQADEQGYREAVLPVLKMLLGR